MKHCTQCGAEIPMDASFCTQCGFKADAQTPEQPEPIAEVVKTVHPIPEETIVAADTYKVVEPPPAYVPPRQQERPPVYSAPPPQQPQSSPYGYGAPPQQQPPQTYGYGAPPPQQPQSPYGYGAPQPQQPPQGYSYGAPPPQQPRGQYPYGQQAPYPAAPGAPQQQYAYAPGPPGQAPKRKRRWWIPVIILGVIAALLLGSYFVFGDQIKQLFVSTEKAWKKAEQASTLFEKDTPLYAMRESSEQLLKQTKFGYATDITLDVKADALDDELAGVLTALSSLRLHMENKLDLNESNPRFNTVVGIGRRGETENILSGEFYDVEDYFVISMPEILPKPLAISKNYLTQMVEDEGGLDIDLDGIFGGMGKVRDNLSVFTGDKIDTMMNDVKEIFFKYAEKPELVKGELLTVGSVSQKLNYFDAVVVADKFAPMAKEILIYMRDNPDVKSLIEGIGQSMEFTETESAYQEFVDEINEMIEEIEDDPEQFKIETHRILYVDAKNNPVGGKFTFTNRGDGDDQNVTIAFLHAEDKGKHAYLMKIETGDEFGFEYLSEYTLKDGLYTGEYKIRSFEMSWDDTPAEYNEVARGTFSAFGLKNVGKELYPVGTITVQAKELNEYADEDMPDAVSLKYTGQLERKDGADHLIATVEIFVEAEGMPITITLGIDHRAIPEGSLTFRNEMATDFVDMSDEDALMELMEDETIMENLMSALSQLGLDLDEFMDD